MNDINSFHSHTSAPHLAAPTDGGVPSIYPHPSQITLPSIHWQGHRGCKQQQPLRRIHTTTTTNITTTDHVGGGTRNRAKQSRRTHPHNMQNTPCERPNGASHADAHTWRCQNPDECRTPEVCGGHRSESRGVEPEFFLFFPPLSSRFSPSRAFSDWSVGGEQLGVRKGGEGKEARRGEGRAVGRSVLSSPR